MLSDVTAAPLQVPLAGETFHDVLVWTASGARTCPSHGSWTACS